MACYRPLRAFRCASGDVVFSELSRHDIIGQIELPCGQCIGCRMGRASDWELRVMHEASLWDENCFITLTYAPGNLPPDGSLHYPDYQAFMRRLRRYFFPRKIRFYMCGEYGEDRGRPHYHACLFNLDFADRVPAGKSKSGEVFYTSPTLERLWGLGHVSVQPLVKETASYCARYIMKKVLGDEAKSAYSVTDPDTGEVRFRRAEFAVCSLKPGIGARWFDRFSSDVFPLDRVVAEGVERRVPRYYDRLAKRAGLDIEEIKAKREALGRAAYADNTDERRRVREVVHKAKVRDLKRDL